jgi:hypothetical protein
LMTARAGMFGPKSKPQIFFTMTTNYNPQGPNWENVVLALAFSLAVVGVVAIILILK